MKRLRMYFKDGSTIILEDCKYIKINKKYFGDEVITDIIPHDKDGKTIGYYYVGNLRKYIIEEQEVE